MPYFAIGVGAIFGIIRGAVMLLVGIRMALARSNNLEQTEQLAARLNAVPRSAAQTNFTVPGGIRTVMTF